ncbi:hypothetical protein J4429_00550 [Candidatus Pacearchaeota archaeon]|nr:hypothetical protein [uncultured archaeon]AQS32547.1 hypothetical protein [uncultured archaeon]AQS33083.1 hypothetical protein [uncultured archaeon]MBS3074927.1 hypothetical protein [Candidatus Pacearchaeota archaeon]
MKIVGFNLLKINVERKEKLEDEKLSVNQNINIKDITGDRIIIGKEEAIKVRFNFIIDYSNNSAKIDFEGLVIILPEKDEARQFLKSWKDRKIPDEFKIPIFNFIVGKCTIKALSLEDEFALPLHFPMPRLQPENQENN